MDIVFFDSGLGGMTVLYEALKLLPKENYVYFADTLNVPYGTKTKERVHECILAAVDKLVGVDTLALVIACNTATSIAINDLRAKYLFPVIGMEPAVKPAVELNKQSGRRVLVLATPLTLREAKYNSLVQRMDDHSIVDSLPIPELVTYCEALEFSESVIHDYFTRAFALVNWKNYSTVVLGCTHFPYYRTLLTSYLPAHVQLIDGSIGTAKRLKAMLPDNIYPASQVNSNYDEDLVDLKRVEFYSSGTDKEYLKRMEQAFLWYAGDQKSSKS
ncbi:MAG: glutamate racemase [Gorillibacterium sp.]|nr:glutamate racemase [Gorillibacterium sp.]